MKIENQIKERVKKTMLKNKKIFKKKDDSKFAFQNFYMQKQRSKSKKLD